MAEELDSVQKEWIRQQCMPEISRYVHNKRAYMQKYSEKPSHFFLLFMRQLAKINVNVRDYEKTPENVQLLISKLESFWIPLMNYFEINEEDIPEEKGL